MLIALEILRKFVKEVYHKELLGDSLFHVSKLKLDVKKT